MVRPFSLYLFLEGKVRSCVRSCPPPPPPPPKFICSYQTSFVPCVHSIPFWLLLDEQVWRSGESAVPPPMWLGFKFPDLSSFVCWFLSLLREVFLSEQLFSLNELRSILKRIYQPFYREKC